MDGVEEMDVAKSVNIHVHFHRRVLTARHDDAWWWRHRGINYKTRFNPIQPSSVLSDEMYTIFAFFTDENGWRTATAEDEDQRNCIKKHNKIGDESSTKKVWISMQQSTHDTNDHLKICKTRHYQFVYISLVFYRVHPPTRHLLCCTTVSARWVDFVSSVWVGEARNCKLKSRVEIRSPWYAFQYCIQDREEKIGILRCFGAASWRWEIQFQEQKSLERERRKERWIKTR